jgi:histidinol-phosphate aminotransferase
VGPRDLVDYIGRLRAPFNVNRLAQVAAAAALDDTAHIEAVARLNDTEKARVRAGLSALGLGCAPSEANFLLVDVERPSKDVYDALLRLGVIVRPMDAYGFGDHIRVTLGRPDENDRFLAAMAEALRAL